jgi:hypothetical protein
MLPNREHPLYYLDAETLLFLGLKWRHPGLDVVRVVDVGLGGKPDLEVLEWAAREGRVVVSRDRATLSAEAARRVSEGRPMPGLILLRWGAGLGRILEDLDRFGAPAPQMNRATGHSIPEVAQTLGYSTLAPPRAARGLPAGPPPTPSPGRGMDHKERRRVALGEARPSRGPEAGLELDEAPGLRPPPPPPPAPG